MSQDVYAALSGSFGAWRQLDVVANNIANAQTTGFKRERVAYESHGPDSAYARIADGLIDARDGTPGATGNPLDVAVQGPGWLMVEGLPGSAGPLLTRDGHLHVDPIDGVLRTATGAAVLGESGPIIVPPGQTATITDDGFVHASDDGELDRLKVVEASAEPVGGNLWRPQGAMIEREPRLVAGALEQSNVDAVTEMVALIEAGRTFEMLQNVMKTSDQLAARLNEFGRG